MLEDFFSITTSVVDDSQAVFSVQFNTEHSIFDGHFPQQKVVPGVCQVEIVKQCLERILGKKTSLVSAGNIKFITMIDPGRNEVVDLKIQWTKNETGCFVVDSVIFAGDIIFLKFKGEFSEDAFVAKSL